MSVTAPPAPAFVDVSAEVLYWAGLSVPVGVGMTIALLAIPEARGGVVASRVRALAPAAAALVAVTAVVHFLAARDLGASVILQIAGYLTVIVGLLMVWKRASRPIAGGLTAVAVLTAAIPLFAGAAPTVDGITRNLATLVHVLGALFWIGGRWVLATVGMMGRRANRRNPDGVDLARTSRDWGQIWEGRFQ